MNSYIDIPRIKNTENTSPWGNTPKFHLNWLRHFSSLEDIYIEIANGNKELLHKYKSLIHSAGYQSNSMLDTSDFIQHIKEIQEGYYHRDLLDDIEYFICNSVKTPKDHNWFDNFSAKNRAFDFGIHTFYNEYCYNGDFKYSKFQRSVSKVLQRVSENYFYAMK